MPNLERSLLYSMMDVFITYQVHKKYTTPPPRPEPKATDLSDKYPEAIDANSFDTRVAIGE